MMYVVCTYAAAAKSLQSCPTLCDPIDCSPPGSSVCGILQARILELGCHFLLREGSNQIFLTQDQTRSLTLAGKFFFFNH